MAVGECWFSVSNAGPCCNPTDQTSCIRGEARRSMSRQTCCSTTKKCLATVFTSRAVAVQPRWIDGSTWLWTAFRNETGSGEGSAGLQFDQIQDGTAG